MSDGAPLRETWEATIFRARLGGLVSTSKSRGAVSGPTFKAVALAWSSHADLDGRNVFPGVARVAVLAEVSYKTAKAVTSALVEWGFLIKDESSSRQFRNYDRYRLAIPERAYFWIPTPDEVKDLAQEKRTAYRGSKSDGDPWAT